MSVETPEKTGENTPQTDPNAPKTDPNAPTPDATPGNGEGGSGDQKPEEAKKATRAKTPDTSGITAEAINAAALAVPDLVAAAAPVRERSAEQKLMDAVAAKAYQAWLDAKKPSVWQKMPVVTYFLDEGEVAAYRYLIRRACGIVEPAEGASGVRVRFGNEFTLSAAMAAKIKHPELEGKIVLAWAAIDKREAADEKPKTDTPTPDDKKNPDVVAANAKHDATPKPEKPKK